MAETIWRNGHGFQPDVEASQSLGQVIITCRKCGVRADNPRAQRPCIGHDLRIPPSGHGITLDVAFTPKGRKTITESVWLDIDALGELVDLARAFPRESRGHAFWHWANPDREFPCETCPSPLGDAARKLAAGQRDAIDADFTEAPKTIGPGV